MKYLIVLTALAGSPVMAQQNCAPHDAVVQFHAEQHKQSRQVLAIDSRGNVIEIFAAENGSWALKMTRPGEMTCFVSSGQAYQHVNEPLPPLGEEG